jgi:DNA-binding response OmpR family regulator
VKKILIIEDNEQLQKYLCEYLTAYGYEPSVLLDYDDVVGEVLRFGADLVLLDINLPKFDGFYFLKLIRRGAADVPVIILSARSDEAEQIRGIEGGAFDYITKPFSIGVLIAKINALAARGVRDESESLQVGGLLLCKSSMTLSCSGEAAELSKNEFKILNLLFARVGEFVSREEILEALWDSSDFVDDNTLTVNISRVKKKLLGLGFSDAIKTKRGVGYALDAGD